MTIQSIAKKLALLDCRPYHPEDYEKYVVEWQNKYGVAKLNRCLNLAVIIKIIRENFNLINFEWFIRDNKYHCGYTGKLLWDYSHLGKSHDSSR